MENEKNLERLHAENEACKDAPRECAPTEEGEDSTGEIEKTTADGAKKRKLPKQLWAAIIAVALVLVILATVLLVNLLRNRRPPALETVRERFEALVEGSYEVNEVLFGKGPATYPRVDVELNDYKVEFNGGTHTIYYKVFSDSRVGTVIAYWYYVIIPEAVDDETKYVAYDIETGHMIGSSGYEKYRYAEKSREARDGYVYRDESTGYYYYPLENYEEPTFSYSSDDEEEYDYVMLEEPYQSVAQIKEAAEKVYSSAYLSRIYEGLFTGIAYGDTESNVLFARYREKKKDGVTYLQKANVVEGLELPERRYDYSTMQIVDGSKAKYVLVEMESYIVGDEENRTVVKLAFALENGSWYLDSPTY